MILVDKLCYLSKLRYVNAGEKFAFAMLTLIFCIVSRSIAMGIFVMAVTGPLYEADDGSADLFAAQHGGYHHQYFQDAS